VFNPRAGERGYNPLGYHSRLPLGLVSLVVLLF
jgi:hypothetical protein